ncbi:hypothetical protein KSC_086100 [Ktedonobacter sp. SOSP1-52]|uniref:hypothetical protein n=1 Tax=Ktedonobacter sp. SOSP1-52 TaxID=2778366 RepID=UPI0019166041|nr:hypothetical protein [Ktedonobacter sp. SOSP1-52]GHO69718.1 hypothetical protein KSC_086100 [Ktedonobacter sp. SOSP1-52]
MQSFTQLAAYNNAVWCDTICRSHNILGEFHDDFWVCQRQTPIYYPNLVTLMPKANINLEHNTLAELLTTKREYSVSVKDSFATLDLAPFGFEQLFQAQWILRELSGETASTRDTDLQWRQITSEKELLRWEEAWSQTSLSQNQLFLPTLLHDADICFIAAYKAKQIVAGAIANRTTGVVGLSNVFTPEQEPEKYWEGLVSMIATCYPDLPIVGYEQDESLETALRAGFTLLGPLSVWLK